VKGSVTFRRMAERDEQMYRVTEAYQPHHFGINPNLIIELERMRKKEQMLLTDSLEEQ